MRTRNKHMNDLIRLLAFEARYNPDPEERKRYYRLWHKAIYAKDYYEDLIYEAQQLGLRNAEFEGDWMGRPADDFD